MTASIQSRPFGTLPGGEAIEAWLITGSGGLVLECIPYGGIVTRLLVPDRDGQSADVVLGFNHLEPYLTGSAYIGAIVGRVAGRIPGASVCIEGVPYPLAANEPPNHLHGGLRGFDRCVWRAEAMAGSDGAPSLRLTLTSPDGDEGYPGEVHVSVAYTVTHDNAFLIETNASDDRTTPLSMTHHAYFNLAGESAGCIEQYAGTCLECEGYPDETNHPELGDILLYPGQTKYEATRYAFSTISRSEARQR